MWCLVISSSNEHQDYSSVYASCSEKTILNEIMTNFEDTEHMSNKQYTIKVAKVPTTKTAILFACLVKMSILNKKNFLVFIQKDFVCKIL